MTERSWIYQANAREVSDSVSCIEVCCHLVTNLKIFNSHLAANHAAICSQMDPIEVLLDKFLSNPFADSGLAALPASDRSNYQIILVQKWHSVMFYIISVTLSWCLPSNSLWWRALGKTGSNQSKTKPCNILKIWCSIYLNPRPSSCFILWENGIDFVPLIFSHICLK